jgi:hypothetical protein
MGSGCSAKCGGGTDSCGNPCNTQACSCQSNGSCSVKCGGGTDNCGNPCNTQACSCQSNGSCSVKCGGGADNCGNPCNTQACNCQSNGSCSVKCGGGTDNCGKSCNTQNCLSYQRSCEISITDYRACAWCTSDPNSTGCHSETNTCNGSCRPGYSSVNGWRLIAPPVITPGWCPTHTPGTQVSSYEDTCTQDP